MKVLVPVKRVVDYNVKVRVKSDGTGVDIANVKMSMNPFDEIAVEEALRLREAGKVKEVVAMTIGPKANADVLKSALALGADRGIHIMTDMSTDQELQPLAVAKIFKKIIEDHEFDLTLMGK